MHYQEGNGPRIPFPAAQKRISRYKAVPRDFLSTADDSDSALGAQSKLLLLLTVSEAYECRAAAIPLTRPFAIAVTRRFRTGRAF